MAKTVKFINGASIMTVPGLGKVTNANLTFEKYEYILSLSKSHAKQFIVTDDEPKVKPVTKPTE